MPVWVLPVMPSMQVYQGSLRLQAAGLMAEQLKARRTPEQAFCAAIRRLAEDPPQASALEAGHKEGFSNGLLLFEPLYSLLAGNPDNLSIDRFANHLMQLTSNKVRVSLGSYWRNQSRFDDALLVQHPSKKPINLAKLMEILRQSCTSIWLAQTAGVEGRRLMHALQQPNLPAEDLPAPPLLANLPILPDRHAVVEQRLRARSDANQPSAAAAAAEIAAEEAAEEAAQPQRGDPMQESASQAVLHMERGLLSRGTRASARQAALFQDRTAADDAAKQNLSSEPSEKEAETEGAAESAAEGDPLSEQDSFYTASEGMNEEEGNGNGGDEDDVARPWDSCCPEAFPWDGKSSLMVCVDPEQRIWYQAHVLKQRGNQYLLSWSAFPDRPEEWVAKNSRRIWRQDQIKREYWHQRAPVFLQSRNRAWVLKACFWDWQMSSRSDHLLHKEPGTTRPRPARVQAVREESMPEAESPINQVLGRGICNGCWNVRSSLQSECGRCKVGACKTCREQWARQRRQGTHANDEGLLVHQANVCFCGAHLTPRGAALYDRKSKRATDATSNSRALKRSTSRPTC
ncbi:TPA: hypothetical protein ACH3X3_006675 [Trebouxia sp. C0006]